MKKRQEQAEEAERQRIKAEMEAKAAQEAAELAKREAEKRDVVDKAATDEPAGKFKYLNHILSIYRRSNLLQH